MLQDLAEIKPVTLVGQSDVRLCGDPLRLSNCPESKIQMYCGQIILSKIRNLPFSNLKEDLHDINAYTIFGENPLIFTKVIVRNKNTDVLRADNFVKS